MNHTIILAALFVGGCVTVSVERIEPTSAPAAPEPVTAPEEVAPTVIIPADAPAPEASRPRTPRRVAPKAEAAVVPDDPADEGDLPPLKRADPIKIGADGERK